MKGQESPKKRGRDEEALKSEQSSVQKARKENELEGELSPTGKRKTREGEETGPVPNDSTPSNKHPRKGPSAPGSVSTVTTTESSPAISTTSSASKTPKKINYSEDLRKIRRIDNLLALIEDCPGDVDKEEHPIPVEAFHKISAMIEDYSEYDSSKSVTYDPSKLTFTITNAQHNIGSAESDSKVEEIHAKLRGLLRDHATQTAEKGKDRAAMTFGALALKLDRLKGDKCNQDNAKILAGLLEKIKAAELIDHTPSIEATETSPQASPDTTPRRKLKVVGSKSRR